MIVYHYIGFRDPFCLCGADPYSPGVGLHTTESLKDLPLPPGEWHRHYKGFHYSDPDIERRWCPECAQKADALWKMMRLS